MACLVVVKGNSAGRKLALEEHRLVMIGRDRDSTFQILDDQVSRSHLQVKWDKDSGRHLAIDFQSSNGVYVNEKRISGETPLRDGDVIQIGATTLVYGLDDDLDAERAVEAMTKGGERWKGTIVNRQNDE